MTRWQSSKVGSVKAKPIECLESSPETSLGSFRDWNIAIPPSTQKTFDAEGEILEHALTRSFRIRNEAIKSLFVDAALLFRRCGKRWIGPKI